MNDIFRQFHSERGRDRKRVGERGREICKSKRQRIRDIKREIVRGRE